MLNFFGRGQRRKSSFDKDLLGGKGANLARMCALGLPVPPGFTISTDVCAAFEEAGGRLPKGLMHEVARMVDRVEKERGREFGSPDNPLLLSVRSGAAVSMPGMMDTVLNLGLNHEVVEGLTRETENARPPWDAYRRLINMFGDVVMGVEHARFEAVFSEIKERFGATSDHEVPAAGMAELCERYLVVYEDAVGTPFPEDPFQQLEAAIEAVFRSWNAPRAIRYREINRITGLRGTAVNVQSMVFGNLGPDSGTGVGFTRDPSSGTNKLYGEFLVNAQGEDVVAGIRTPRPIAELRAWNSRVYSELLRIKETLEQHYHDMQDIEFTIQRGELFLLQTRTGKRTAKAALKIAVDMVAEELITVDEALNRVPPEDLSQLLLPSFSAAAKRDVVVLTKGLAASPGAATGKLAFSAEEAVERAKAGEEVILVRRETSADDVDGMHHAAGILTSTGGMTSHAAVVARGWGRCCVAGAGALAIDAGRRRLTVAGRVFGPDSVLSLDGSSGEVMEGEVARSQARLSRPFARVMEWADQRRRLRVRANADTPEDARRARRYGAEGIGLTRTEHMFFQPDRLSSVRKMILAEDETARRAALAELLPLQRRDFVGLLTAMKGYPVTIRLLDPPLHEFLPHDPGAQKALAEELGLPATRVRARVERLHEANPMLGHRGSRLAVTFPEILEMQVTAIVKATIHCLRKGVDAQPEIMLPLVGTREEFLHLRHLVEDTMEAARDDAGCDEELIIPIGTMIEVPRAALVAESIAEVADFVSFGTNDLTQLTLGYSRDDVNTFLPAYLELGLLPRDPFQSIDVEGVGSLVASAVRGVHAAGDIHAGVCGEHGGDPDSIAFFHRAGLDYVSCSPFRVPTARLAAAQAAVRG